VDPLTLASRARVEPILSARAAKRLASATCSANCISNEANTMEHPAFS